jgi:hypothetical protein
MVLKESQSQRRKELISEIYYNYALGLKKGDYYIGQAEIKFYLNEVPQNDDELFLQSQAMAVSNLTINTHVIGQHSGFENQMIKLRPHDVKKGWNTVKMRYFTPYNKNRVGLHTFIDA